MKRQQLKRRKIIKASISINQLPEQIFHEIFKYINYDTIIISLREVCTKFRQHVDTFVRIIGIFMLTGSTDSTDSKVMYVFKTHKNEIKGMFKVGPGCPIKPSSSISLSDAKFVVSTDNFDRRSIKELNDKLLIDTFNSVFLMFDWKYLKWIISPKAISFCNDCAKHNWKLTSNPDLFNFHSGSNFLCHSTGVIRNTNEYHTSLFARYLNINKSDDDIHDSFSWCTFQVHIPPRLKCTFNSKMIRCGTGGVIFIGGNYTPPQGLFSENQSVHLHDNMKDTSITDQSIRNQILWHGEISSCGNYMFWNAIDLGISFIRPIGFKLKNSLFIIDPLKTSGDFHLNPISSTWIYRSKMDKYDLLRKQYHHNVFELPFMYVFSFDEPKIVTDRNETFALIVVREIFDNVCKERVWIFTESDGFKEMTDLYCRFHLLDSLDNGLLIRVK